jgi:hypothetical protein
VPESFVQTLLNNSMVTFNRDGAGEVAAQRVNGRPTDGETCDHDNDPAGRENIATSFDSSDTRETDDDADAADTSRAIPDRSGEPIPSGAFGFVIKRMYPLGD